MKRPFLGVGSESQPFDVSRAVLLHVCRDGTVTYRRREQPIFNGAALAVFSVDTEEEAEELRVLACVSRLGHHPLLPGKKWYRVGGDFGEELELEDLARVAERFRRTQEMLKNAPGRVRA